MKKNKTLVFVLLFLLTCFLGGFYFYFNPNILYFFKGEKDFSKLIVEIDFYIDRKKFAGAKKAIQFSSYYANTEFKWLALIKRSKVWALYTGDFSLMGDIVNLSVKALPGNLKLRALEVYSKLKVGSLKEAYRIANNYLLDSEEYRGLYNEVFIKNLSVDNQIVDFNKFIDKIYREKDASIFEEIGLNLKNNAFLVNAMLLYIEKKNMEAAKRILSKIKEDKNFFKELAYISYNLNDLDFTISNLKFIENGNDPTLLFLLADAYFKKGDVKNAKNEYLKLYTKFPDYNVLVYLNLALIANNENDFKRAISYLNKANEVFKGNKIINYYLANIYFRIKNYSKANEIIANYKEDPLFFKIYFALNYANSEYEAKKSYLWRIFYKTEYNSNIAQFLAWNLLLYSDLKDLDLFFRIYGFSENKQDWYDFYKFYYYFLKRDFISAKKVILDNKAQKYMFGSYYNLGVLSFSEKNYKEAERYFNEGISLLPSSFYDKDASTDYELEFVSKIYLKQGINYLYLGKMEEGKGAILASYSFYETDEGRLYKNMIDTLRERKLNFD
ncbi:tetratricopeptide repeat protein [Borreliella yangtzensis]|uniref:Tetratricopeptide (TPR) repeat protein n=1 Tax=Borreliella yangtzensis TaxID=683292 RepID=A0ABR6PEK6_9SPIR|nr:tetratricopeptide repeat protein [Borreliella yangtzensis]MBB6043136.1 tetratricopeptide (TPR) repeat protein [Borreliella yangtzensis]WKC73101.1 tetratricopeptide repeat protein [Borreliella yangtzensis]WKC74018.1 tetratricopeptide repeat protein [Borreliella yangtzensis]